mgnify:CR=1 FL=1
MDKRVLVFMTYLNDVTDEGETEWYYQRVKVKPRKGLTVIDPGSYDMADAYVIAQAGMIMNK